MNSYVNVLIFAQLQHTQFMCGLFIVHIQMHVILIPYKDHTFYKKNKFTMNIDCMNCAIFEYQNTQKCYDECVIATNVATTLLTQCSYFN